MGSLLDMNRAEREEYVISLYKENKSTREIAKLTHMSFRDIGAITKKLKLEAGGERGSLEEDDDIKSKSKTTQALKLFSELESPVEVAIALDLPADQAQAICLEYWRLDGMYRLAQIYEEAKYDLYSLLRLHKIVKDLEMTEHDIKNVLELAKYNELRHLQRKVEYLRYEISTLEMERMKSNNQLFKLNTAIHEFEENLAQKRRELIHIKQELSKYDNTGKLCLILTSESDTTSHSLSDAP